MLRIFKDHHGFSIVQVLISLGLSAVLAGVMSAGLLGNIKMRNRAEDHSALYTTHTLAIQATRNLSHIEEIIIEPNPALTACLKHLGSQCKRYETEMLFPESSTLLIKLNTFFSASTQDCPTLSADCAYVRQVRYRFNCSSETSCESMNLKVRTFIHPTYSTKKFEDLENSFQLNSLSFKGQQKVSYGCTTDGSVITGMDYAEFRAKCDGIGSIHHNCTARKDGQIRMISSVSDSCADIVTVTCAAFGISGVGWTQAGSSCTTLSSGELQ